MRLLLFSFVLLLVSSCKQERYELPLKEDVTILLSVCDEGETKSVPIVDEDAISDINLFFYDINGMLAFSEYVEHPGRKIEAQIYADREYSLYAVANVGSLIEDQKVMTERGLLALALEISDKRDIVNPDGTLPMSARLPLQQISKGESLELPLVRMVSRFRLIVDTSSLESDLDKFEIKRVTLKNLNKKVFYFERSRAASEEDLLDAGESYRGEDLYPIFTTGVDFYLLENAQGDLLSGNTTEQGHVPPDDFAGLCTYVEIVVDYRSSSHYDENLIYRYYLHDGSKLDNFDVLRNTMYLCTTHFTGDGISENSWRVDLSGMKDLVVSMNIAPSSFTFTELDQTLTLEPQIAPATAENPNLNYLSTDPTIAQVDSYGVVRPQGDGVCKIVATTTDGTEISDTCHIVVDTRKRPEQIMITPSSANIYVGGEVEFVAIVLPQECENKEVIWHSENISVATITESGIAYGLSKGSSTITATTKENGIVAEAILTVSDKDFILDPIPEILYPNYNSPHILTWSSEPSGTPAFSLTTLSGDPLGSILDGFELCAYNSLPKRYGLIGTYTLEAQLNGVIKSHLFKVSAGRVNIDRTILPTTIYMGEKLEMKLADLEPFDAPVVWSVDNTSVARVSSDGNLSLLRAGVITLRAESVTGAYDQVQINVHEPTISISENLLTVYEGTTKKATLQASAAGRLPVKWEVVSGSSYASVDQNGVVTGLKRSNNSAIKVRVSYQRYPHIYDEVSVAVLPAVDIMLGDSNQLLNSTGFSSAHVNSIPKTISLDVFRGPGITPIWRVRDGDGNLTNDISITADGIVSAKGNANGVYTIEAWDNTMTYKSSQVSIDVYRYLEYEVGLEQNGQQDLVENGASVRFVYSMNSRWSSNISAFALSTPLSSAKIICYPEGNYRSAQVLAGSGNTPIIFARNVVLEDSYVPSFDIWDYLVPRSYLYDSATSQTKSGLTGMVLKLSQNKNFFFIKQRSGGFYNEGSFSELR